MIFIIDEHGHTENPIDVLSGSTLLGVRSRLNLTGNVTVTDNPTKDTLDINFTTGAGVGGSGATNQVAYWSSSSNIAGNTGFTWDTVTATLAPSASTSGSPKILVVTGPAHTSLTADTEAIDIHFNLSRTVQFTSGGGAFSRQRAVVFDPPTYAFTSADTITTVATVSITGSPIAGSNATLTNTLAFWVESGRTALGTSPTGWSVSNLLVGGTLTSDTTIGIFYVGTLTASQNGALQFGTYLFPTYAKGSFTGLLATGLYVEVPSVTGAGTISQYAAGEFQEATIATANIGLLVGGHPGGSTNFAIYTANSTASRLGGSLTVVGAFGTNSKAAQTSFASGGALAAYVAGANGLDTGAHMSALHALVVAIRAALVADGIMS